MDERQITKALLAIGTARRAWERLGKTKRAYATRINKLPPDERREVLRRLGWKTLDFEALR